MTGTLDGATFTQSGIRKYYSIAGITVAVNTWDVTPGTWNLSYLLTDHLGSVVAVTDSNGTLTSQQRYLPFGQVRTDLNGPRITETDFGYTGQRALDMGLMDYKARFYDGLLGRFISPDSITVGDGSQAYNRYAYVNNNPVNATDPSGHVPCSNKIIRDDQIVCTGGSGGVAESGGGGSSDSARLSKYPDDCDKVGFRGYCYTGDQMKELYGWYVSHPGQWNNYDINNSFTPTDFLGWMLNAEIGITLNNPKTREYAKTLVSEKMMWLCEQFSPTGSCGAINDNAIFNYVATRASAAMRYDLYGAGKDPDPSSPYYSPERVSYSAQIAKDAVSYTGTGSLADWGNRSMFKNPKTITALSQASSGTNRYQYLTTYNGPDPLYFFSATQNLYWFCVDNGGTSC